MDSEMRRYQVESHQQQLRNEAAAERLARGNKDRVGPVQPTTRLPRTIGALRRLIGTAAA